MFAKSYWGYNDYKDANLEIINNRNAFVHDYAISTFVSNWPKYVFYQSQISEILKNMQHSLPRSFADHAECYKTKDNGYLVIVSPYTNCSAEAYCRGYREIAPLYDISCPTYIKTDFLRCHKTVKDYYKDQLEFNANST